MEPNASQASEDAVQQFRPPCSATAPKYCLHATAISSSHLDHMKPEPSNNRADAIIGKKSVENADQCPRVAGVSQMPDSEVQGRGTVRKLIQDPNCLAFVFADLPDDGSNVAITCPVSGHLFYASVSERL
jgi:hypothetical protein